MTDYDELNKFLLISKPCQSGKTSLVIENIKKLLQIIDQEYIDNNISIVFCDNSLLQTEQINKRIEDENINVKIISSKSEIKSVDELYRKIINDDIKVIICCTNKTQIANINKLLDYFDISDKKNKLNENYNFHFFIDEVDKTFGSSFFDNILNWEKNKKITKITVITATPERFLKKMGSDKIPILPLEYSYNRDSYHKIDDSYIENLEENNFYMEYILQNYTFSNNCFLFCPGKIKKISHYDIQKLLNESDFNVLVINSDGNNLYYKDDKPSIKITKEDLIKKYKGQNVELSRWLSDIYNDPEYKLKNNKFAITGNLSIGRGITISSPTFMITDAIIPTESSNISNLYQLAGRICGNIKLWSNYKKPRIFGTEKGIKKIIECQNKVINLVEHCYKNNINEININDYNMINADEKYGIPIKIRFNIIAKFNTLIEKIKEYKGGNFDTPLNNNSRSKIMRKIKKYCQLEDVCDIYNNNDYDIDLDNYIIKNIKIIGYDGQNFETVNKNPLIKINKYIESKKRFEAEKSNCEIPGECIFYILCGNYQKFLENDVNEGDIYITFIKN